ncbi:MAG: sulfatase [Saprospiraceae bacterium]|nr:sulfatase [Saprospiraceae bacterium]
MGVHRQIKRNLYWNGISNNILAVCMVLAMFLCCACAPKNMVRKKTNVLFIVVDDLRPILGCYGNAIIKSPHIDALAKAGVLFESAYCQQAVCNPSRTSVLTGLRPDQSGVWNLKTHFRNLDSNVITLPQLFKSNAYAAREVGKIFHDGAEFKDPDSWSGTSFYNVTRNEPNHKYVLTQNLVPSRAKAAPTEQAEVGDDSYIDGKVASKAIDLMRELKDSSFFLAVGFRRPHLPFSAPKKYWDLYKRGDFVSELQDSLVPLGTPEIALTNSNELRGYDGIEKDRVLAREKQLELLHGYYASTSFVDAQIGKILTALKDLHLDDNTIIVLWSDHGFHLGEFGIWCKSTNFEAATRVPLIFAGPDFKKNKRVKTMTELIDIYPTLADLAGLQLPDKLKGKSLRKQLTTTIDIVGDGYALSQFIRPYESLNKGLPEAMGYSIRSKDFRYTEWRSFDDMKVLDRELYDLSLNPQESENIADSPNYTEMMRLLSTKIDAIRK